MRVVIDTTALTNAGFAVEEFEIRDHQFILQVEGTMQMPCAPINAKFVKWLQDHGWTEAELDELVGKTHDAINMIRLKSVIFK